MVRIFVNWPKFFYSIQRSFVYISELVYKLGQVSGTLANVSHLLNEEGSKLSDHN